MSESKLKHKILLTEVRKLDFPIATMPNHVLGAMPPRFKFKNIFDVCAGIHNNGNPDNFPSDGALGVISEKQNKSTGNLSHWFRHTAWICFIYSVYNCQHHMTLWYINFILLGFLQDDVWSHMVENMEVNVKHKCYSTLDCSKIITVVYITAQCSLP